MIVGCRDILTVVPFSVPVSTTLTVSGGGAALSGTLVGALPGDRLLITDSLNYDPIALQGLTDVTIEADTGQTPSITATAGPGNHCVDIQDGNSGIALRGLTFIGSGNASPSATPLVDGLVALPDGVPGGIDRVIIEDCIFTEPAATAIDGAPGLLLVGTDGTMHQDVWVHRCSFRNNAAYTAIPTSYGALLIGGFSGVYIQNSEIVRDEAVLPRVLSRMRGVVVKNIDTTIEDVLVSDIGNADQNQAFRQSVGGLGTAIGTTTLRNCVSYNCRIGYELSLAGASMAINNCVSNVDIPGLAGGVQMRFLAGVSYIVRDSVIVGAGDAIAFSPAGVTEDHNDVFNWGATGKVLDPTDITVDPLFEDVPNGDWLATEAACQTAATDGGLVGVRYPGGEKIIWCNP